MLILQQLLSLVRIAVKAGEVLPRVVAHDDLAGAHRGAVDLFGVADLIAAGDELVGDLGLVVGGLALVLVFLAVVGHAGGDIDALVAVLVVEVAMAEGAGVEHQIAGVAGDDCAIELGVAFGVDVDAIAALDAGLLTYPVALAVGLADGDRAAAATETTRAAMALAVAFDAILVTYGGDRKVAADIDLQPAAFHRGAGDQGVAAAAQVDITTRVEVSVVLP